MNISVLEGSNYFKGLLVLIRKDNRITESERALMSRIGKALGFEKKFIENAIQEILDNTYVSETPPVFSSRELAEKFLKDGLLLAASDNEIHPHEEEWLLAVAKKNSIETSWFFHEKKSIVLLKESTVHLEADDIAVLY